MSEKPQHPKPKPIALDSREIAQMVERRHDVILRAIARMLRQRRLDPSDFRADYQDTLGKLRKAYRLPYDLAVTLITGYGVHAYSKAQIRFAELEEEARVEAVMASLVANPRLLQVALRYIGERLADANRQGLAVLRSD